MQNFTYEELKQGLKRNEEYEFYFGSDTYSFSCNEKGWYLTKFSDCENYQTFNSGLELLEKGKIEGKYIIEIFDKLDFYLF